MIVLDTNLISEPLKPAPSAAVMGWLNSQQPYTLFLTAISLSEILAGFSMMPRGKRRDDLARETMAVIDQFLGSRILAFDTAAAHAYAELLEAAKINRRPLPQSDAQIAAIVKAHGFAVATRDPSPFIAAGLEVINPWEAK